MDKNLVPGPRTPGRHAAGRLHNPPARPDLFKVFLVFLLCGFAGWVFETAFVWAVIGRFTRRGFLFVMQPLGQYLPFLNSIPVLRSVPLVWGLPLILLYGVGGTIMVFAFRRLAHRPVLLFFTGMAVLTLLELLTSYFSSYVLHKSFWDYSGTFLNFEGRISLHASLAWGALSVVAVKLLAPWADKFYEWARGHRYFRPVVGALMVYTLVCALVKYWLYPDIVPT